MFPAEPDSWEPWVINRGPENSTWGRALASQRAVLLLLLNRDLLSTVLWTWNVLWGFMHWWPWRWSLEGEVALWTGTLKGLGGDQASIKRQPQLLQAPGFSVRRMKFLLPRCSLLVTCKLNCEPIIPKVFSTLKILRGPLPVFPE